MPARPPQPLRVLVVEDVESMRFAVQALLEQAGCQVVAAADGRDGLAAFRVGAFDLVVTDNQMPNMIGLEMARAIKALSPRTPIVMVTMDHKLAEGAPPRGLDRVLAKPVADRDLLDAVREALAAYG